MRRRERPGREMEQDREILSWLKRFMVARLLLTIFVCFVVIMINSKNGISSGRTGKKSTRRWLRRGFQKEPQHFA